MNDIYNEIEKYFESPSGQALMDKLVEDIRSEQKITEKITQTDDYINWLEIFTTKNPKFSDSNSFYFPKKLSEDDKENISKLGNFYDAIKIYAYKNYIYGTSNNFGNQYYIKYNNVGYEIKIVTGQGTILSVTRQKITKNNSDDFIDFKLIQKNEVTKRAKMIREKLDKLNNLINTLDEENVPFEAIVDTADERLHSIYKKKLKK